MRRSPENPVTLPAESVNVSITGAAESSAQRPRSLEGRTPLGEFGAPLTRLRARGIKGEPVPPESDPRDPIDSPGGGSNPDGTGDDRPGGPLLRTGIRSGGNGSERPPQGPGPINPDRPPTKPGVTSEFARGSAPVKDLVPGVAIKMPARRVLAR